MEALTPSQPDALNEFVVITGLSLDDETTTAKAMALLSHYDYDLNNAVLAFFENGFELPVPERAPVPVVESHPGFMETSAVSGSGKYDAGSYRNLQGDFSYGELLPKLVKAPRISNKWQLALGIHVSRRAFRENDERNEKNEKTEAVSTEKHSKISILWVILMIVPRTLSLLYSAFRYFFGLNLTTGVYDEGRSHFNYDAYDETYDAKASLLDENIVSSYNIAHEDFNGCHESSQLDFRFLLGVLCDDKSTQFTQKLLQTEAFGGLFSKRSGQFKETQLFVNNVDKSPEAFEVAKTYNFRKIPVVFLAGNVTRDHAVMSSMSVVYKASCSLGDDEEQEVLMQKMVKNLGRTLNDYNPQLVTKRLDKQEIEMSRVIKEKQDEAYLESLQSDKVKKLEKENQRMQQEMQEKLISLRKGVVKHFLQAKYFDQQVEGLTASNAVRISIKLPDGRRIVQKFPKSASVGEIYLFVETQLANEDNEVEAAEMTVSAFLEQFEFSFELFKPLPKCCLPSSPETIEDFGNLKSGDNVMFEYIDTDNDDTTV